MANKPGNKVWADETSKKVVEKVWVDIETTGLADDDVVLELGLALTDKWGSLIKSAKWLVSDNTPRYWDAIKRGMQHDMVGPMHERSGLWKDWEIATEVHANDPDILFPSHVEAYAIKFLQSYQLNSNTFSMTGRSIHFDRTKLNQQMPVLEGWFHYRNFDISTFYQVALDHNPNVARQARLVSTEAGENHRVDSDLLSTIAEYQFYLDNLIFVSS